MEKYKRKNELCMRRSGTMKKEKKKEKKKYKKRSFLFLPFFLVDVDTFLVCTRIVFLSLYVCIYRYLYICLYINIFRCEYIPI